MKYILILATFFCCMATGYAQEQRIDALPGLYEIKVGNPFEPVKALFGTVTEKDIQTGQEYFVLLNPEQTVYADVLGIKIQKLEVYVNKDGVIEEIIVIYPKKVKLSQVTDKAVELYGPAPCMLAVKNKEAGGCFWDGEQFSLQVSHEETPTVMAKFLRMVK